MLYVNTAAEIELRAECKLGDMLKKVEKNKGASAGGKKSGPRGSIVEPRDTTMDQSEAVKVYTKRQGLSKDIQNTAAEIELRAECKLGDMLKKVEKNKGGWEQKNKSCSPKEEPQDTTQTIPELLDLPKSQAKKLSARSQQLAAIPKKKIEKAKGSPGNQHTGPVPEKNQSNMTIPELLDLPKSQAKKAWNITTANTNNVVMQENGTVVRNTTTVIFTEGLLRDITSLTKT